MGSSVGNLPLYTKVSPVKLKHSASEALTTLTPLIKKIHELSLGIVSFFKPQNIKLLTYIATKMIFHHFAMENFFYNDKL
jgi:hypothetical protein